MDKAVKLLEQHVQWLVLALALAWVCWQGYSYIVKEPLTVVVGSPPVTVTPGTADPVIRDGSTRKLEAAIANPQVDPPAPAKVLEIVTRALTEADANAVQVAGLSTGSEHVPDVTGGGPEEKEKKVAELPKPPPALADKFTTRWTVITVPATTQPAAAAPANPAAPGAPVQPVMVREDVAYFSGLFTIDAARLRAEIDRCFSQTNVPPALLTAEFVRVELLREEQKTDGSWGPPAMIAALPIHTILPHPADDKPMLVGDKLKEALYKYKEWFEGNQDIIVRPAFYQTAPDAEVWVQPGDLAPVAAQSVQAVVERPFDPSRDVPKTPEQIQQKQAYDQMIRARNAQLRRGPGARGPYGTTGAFAPPYGGGGPPVGRPGYERPGLPVYPPTTPGIPPALVNPNAGNQANPNNLGLPNQNIQILVHDVTIQEGKTYRYCVRYKLFNPMWDHPKLAVDSVAATFDIDSPDATNPKSLDAIKKDDPKFDAEKMWTPPINVEPLAHIFVTRINATGFGASNQADFVVYTWKDGHWKEATAKKLTPGDVVRDAKSVTPWTVVDVRKDTHSGEAYVILMDERGILSRRDEASDAQSKEWEKLKGEAGAAAAAR